MKHILIAFAACAALAACGGGTGDAGGTTAADTTPAAKDTGSSGSTGDSFLAEVKRVLGLTADSAEPSSIDAATVTTPEDKEPEPVS